MSQFESRIMKLRDELFIMKFSNEVNNLKKNDLNNMLTDDRVQTLTDIINNKLVDNNNIKKSKKPQSSDFHQYLDEISKNAYRKPWNSLQKFHKSIKLKEFSSNLTDDKKLQEEIYSKLIDSLNNKHIHTSKNVTYDYEKETIISINGLEFNSDNNTYKYKYK